VLGTRVDEQQVAVAERPRGGREVQDGAVVARRDDRLERQEVAAVPEEGRLEHDLQLALGAARGDQRHERLEAGARGLRGGAHARELDVVLRAPDVDERVTQLDVGVGGRAEPAHRPAVDPCVEVTHRARAVGHAFAVALEPRPQQLVGGDRRDELDPPVGRRVGQDAAGAFAVREVEVLGVRAERVRPVTAPRHRDLLAGGDQHDAAVEVPCRRGRRAPPLEEGLRHPDRRALNAALPWQVPTASSTRPPVIRRSASFPRIRIAVAASGVAAPTNVPSGAMRTRGTLAVPICVVNRLTIPGVGQSIGTWALKPRSSRPRSAIRRRTERRPPLRPA
jgi:hypothetical protein